MDLGYEARVREAADFLRPKLGKTPEFGLTLGSGLGKVANRLSTSGIIPYTEIPGAPVPSMPGHAGSLYIGVLEGVPLLGFKGRKHYQENPTPEGLAEIVFNVHLAAELGIGTYFATNAAGGANPNYNPRDLVAITDQISLFMPDPLTGRVLDFEKVGGGKPEVFQPMADAYDPELTKLLIEAGNLKQGVYNAKTGRSYETPAEARLLRLLGADLLGMSTTPEVIVARNRGMKVVGMSVVTNVFDENGYTDVDHKGVVDVANDPVVQAKIAHVLPAFFAAYREQFMR